MIAPLWWIDDVANAFSAVKYVDVLVMTSVIFPTYFLARLFMRRGWALFAATGAAAIPSVAYSSWIVEETLAYPFAALCFFLIVKAFVERSRWWVLGASAASLVAPFVRGELIVIPIVLVIGTLFALWSSDSGIARRATWSWDTYLGVILLVFGAIFTISAFASHHSQQWYSVTYYYKHRAIVLGDWAAGALAIGMGVIPFVVGLAGLFAARGEERSREVRMFRAVAAAGIIGFALYTGMKAAYLQSVFATRVEERNLIYIAPLLFIGAALVFERRRVNPVALAVAAAYGFYLIVGTPFQMGVQLYSDSLGFSILQQANRYYEWTPAGAQWLLIGVLVAGVALVVLTLQRRVSAAAATAIAAVLAVGILAWNVTGEISASAGDVSIARGTGAILRHPYTWVDDVAHGKPTLYLGQGVADQRAEWLLEFWNRSIVTVNSLDSTLVGPGPSGTPNIAADGRIYWSLTPDDPGRTYDYAVEDWPEGVAADPADEAQPAPRGVQRHLRGRLDRRERQHVLPLRELQAGLAADRDHAAELARKPGARPVRLDPHLVQGARRGQDLPPAPVRDSQGANEGHLAANAGTAVWSKSRRRQEVRPSRARPGRDLRPAPARSAGRLPLLQEAPARREAAIIKVNR